MRVAIYTRLSPNPKKDDTVNQERDLLEYCQANKHQVIKHYKDVHVSGSKKGKDRPQFTQMMEDARKRKFDLVLFWSLDRLSREGVYETITYLNQFNSYGVDYKSYTEQYLDSCGMFKDAIIAVMAVIAKQERVRLVERTIAGLETARAKGKTLGRPFATVRTENRSNPVDLEIVRKMRLQGKSFRQIGKHFGAGASTIYRMMKDEKV